MKLTDDELQAVLSAVRAAFRFDPRNAVLFSAINKLQAVQSEDVPTGLMKQSKHGQK